MSQWLWEVPESWTWTKLDVIADWASGGTPKSTETKFYNGSIPWLIIGDLTDGMVTSSAKRITTLGFENSSAKMVNKGAILIAMYGSIGKLGIAGIECSTNQAIAFTERIQSDVESKYLFYYLLRARTDLNEIGKGGTQQNISQTVLKQFSICIAPLNEQRRIVAKLETLMSRVNAAQARLATIPHILKRFRQSVLAAACSGKLTADWREQDSLFDSTSDITERVFEFRRATWEQIQLQKMRSNGKSPKNQKWKLYPEPDETRSADLPELPKRWAWLKLGILGRDPLNTVQTGPFGALLHNSEFTETGVAVVAVGNLTGMGFSHDGLYFITKVKAEQLARFDVWAGDVLFARSGATTGKVCVAPPEVQDWRMTGHILRARLNTDVVLPQFVVYALHGSPAVKEQVTGNLRGATRPGFNTSLLEVIDIPVAPLAEQQEIVRRVEALFKTADALEARYSTAKAHVDKLTQSILAKAFRGELVPQDPNDEPATLMLELINKKGRKAVRPKRRRAAG